METLICGTTGVEVKTGVGDNVSVGVSVGNSGVKVELGDSTMEMGRTDVADCVKPEAMVCAMAVFMEFESGVEIPGEVQAWEAINKTETDKRIRVVFNIFPPFGEQSRSECQNKGLFPHLKDV